MCIVAIAIIFAGLKRFPKILLASKSPRRQFLLREAGFDLEIVDIDCDENYDDTLKKSMIAEYLAEKKATAFKGELLGNILVTADTIVCLSNHVLNKPANENEAIEMLRLLSGNTHEVFTGVCIRYNNKQVVFHERTEVSFRNLSDEEIVFYIQKYHPFDKAGSYGVQDWMGYVGVNAVNGCFYNVMGFPVSRFYTELIKIVNRNKKL